MCSILCCIEIFPIGSSHLPFGNGTYFISDVAGLDLDFLAQPKLLLGLCHSCFKLQAVYYCLLLGPKSSYFPTPNCVKFEMSMKKNNWLPICSQNLVSEFPIPSFFFSKTRSFCLNFFCEPVGVEHAHCHASWVMSGVKSATLVAKFSTQ